MSLPREKGPAAMPGLLTPGTVSDTGVRGRRLDFGLRRNVSARGAARLEAFGLNFHTYRTEGLGNCFQMGVATRYLQWPASAGD